MKTSRFIVAALAVALSTTVVNAQQHGAPDADNTRQRGMMGQMMGGGMMGGGMMGRNCSMAGMMKGGGGDTFVAGRIAFLKAELAITADQTDVFEAYADALKNNLQGMHAMRQNMMGMMDAKSPVEQLDGRLAMMEARLETLKSIKEPLAALYSTLSDMQKEKADKVLTAAGCMM